MKIKGVNTGRNHDVLPLNDAVMVGLKRFLESHTYKILIKYGEEIVIYKIEQNIIIPYLRCIYDSTKHYYYEDSFQAILLKSLNFFNNVILKEIEKAPKVTTKKGLEAMRKVYKEKYVSVGNNFKFVEFKENPLKLSFYSSAKVTFP